MIVNILFNSILDQYGVEDCIDYHDYQDFFSLMMAILSEIPIILIFCCVKGMCKCLKWWLMSLNAFPG